MTVLNWIWNNRTKSVGYLGIVLGTLATSSVVPPKVAAWCLLISALITAGIGHFNSATIKDNGENSGV